MNRYRRLFQKFLREQIYQYRSLYSISQEEMAENLHISPRSYCDQENGKYGFSALSLTYFLMLLSEREVLKFLYDFRILLKQNEKGDIS